MKTRTDNINDLPKCFGDLEIVFPEDTDGLRKTPEECMTGCSRKTECLRAAMQNGVFGLKAREKYVDRAYESGMMGFFERWSQKKRLNRRMAQKKK